MKKLNYSLQTQCGLSQPLFLLTHLNHSSSLSLSLQTHLGLVYNKIEIKIEDVCGGGMEWREGGKGGTELEVGMCVVTLKY